DEVDAVLGEGAGFLGRRLAVDAARLDLAEMDPARLLGEFVADIVGVLLGLLGHRLQPGERLALFLAHGERHLLLLAPRRHGRRHQRLLDPRRLADRAGDEAALPLRLEILAVAEPAVEGVLVVAGEREADHRAAPASASSAVPAWATRNSRAFLRLGILARASATAPRS